MGTWDYLLTFLAFALQIAVIAGLLRGRYREYPILLALIICDLLGTVVSMAAVFDLGKWTYESAKIYWMCQGVQFALVLAFQLHMLYPTLHERSRRIRLAHLLLLAVLVTGLSAWFSYHVRFSYWMTQMARNLCFASIFLNLALWTSLVRSYDRERLMIVASLGFLLAGGAIGHSLRQISRDLVFIGNVVLVSLYLLSLFTLWRTFRTAPVHAQERSTSGPLAQVSL